MSEQFSNVLLLLILILINGLFSMTEMAVVSVRKARLQSDVEKGNKSASAALELADNPNEFFSTIQIVITLVSIFTGAFGATLFSGGLAQLLRKLPMISKSADTLALIIVSIIITYFSLVIGELVPKRLAISSPESIAMSMAGVMKVISKISKPLVVFLSWSTSQIVKLLRLKENNELPVSEEEVKVMIEQGKLVGIFDETEQDIVESVFRMSDRMVEAMMTPRTEITWIDLEEPLDEILEEIRESDGNYFPLVRGNADNIVGIVSAKKILDAFIRKDQIDLEAIAESPLFIPESKPALSVLDNLRESGTHVAIILDEYGGFSGMITLLDILEELVGDVPRSDENYDPQIVERADGSWLFDGQLDIDEMKDILNIKELEDEDRVGFQTLGGFILSQFGFIPTVGDFFELGKYRFEVVDMDNRRIDKVLVTQIDSNQESASDKENPG